MRRRGIKTNRRRALRVVVAVTGVAVLAACLIEGPTDGPNTRGSSDDATSAVDASRDADEVLERYGIALPESASTPQLELLPENVGRDEGYRLSFTVEPDEVEQLCADINGPLPAPRLTETRAEVLGVEEPPDGAQLCSGSRPENLRQQIQLLYAGDPAEVTLALYLMPVR
ncbi:hypothetical protein [Bogoriella caseilytica]|uniref:Uncharacterized protein n=1 Tax=Bogoriella caseilytica TaxID=56055 RepID=A0A3N2BFA3_9MICO|nr:hypothetical protein [Bogoriella caseilytica]ROR73915.1 hypothetical protein EDD31_2310 [Bogoriella caseilytica]